MWTPENIQILNIVTTDAIRFEVKSCLFTFQPKTLKHRLHYYMVGYGYMVVKVKYNRIHEHKGNILKVWDFKPCEEDRIVNINWLQCTRKLTWNMKWCFCFYYIITKYSTNTLEALLYVPVSMYNSFLFFYVMTKLSFTACTTHTTHSQLYFCFVVCWLLTPRIYLL